MKGVFDWLWEWGFRECFRTVYDFRLIVLILLINTFLTVMYLIIHLRKHQWKKGLLLSIFMLLVPVVGPLYLMLGELLRAIQMSFGDLDINMAELSFSKKRIPQVVEADTEKERNVVPLEEALLVSGRNDKRQTFMEAVKGGSVDDLNVIRDAVADHDPEIAHYAASYMTDMLARVKGRESTLRSAFENNMTVLTCDNYMRHLRHALSMGIFEGAEHRKYLERLENAYLWKLENAPQDCAVWDMTVLMRQWLLLHDMDKAKQWFAQIRPRCYEDLDALKACATYYYSSHNRDALLEILSEVCSSPLELDNEALEWIRFFEDTADAH